MATINLNQPTKSSGGSGEERAVLPTDTYRMKIIDAVIEDDRWAKPNRDGSQPQVLALTFEVSNLTDEQADTAAELEEDWSEVRVWKRFNPFYGPVKAGGPSKFKAFIDDLVGWGLLNIPDMNAFDVESLCGIELKCSVENYIKQQGENAGKPGNRINAFAPVRVKGAKKNTPEPTTVDTRPELAAADQF
jgi:hypothetical protein